MNDLTKHLKVSDALPPGSIVIAAPGAVYLPRQNIHIDIWYEPNGSARVVATGSAQVDLSKIVIVKNIALPVEHEETTPDDTES